MSFWLCNFPNEIGNYERIIYLIWLYKVGQPICVKLNKVDIYIHKESRVFSMAIIYQIFRTHTMHWNHILLLKQCTCTMISTWLSTNNAEMQLLKDTQKLVRTEAKASGDLASPFDTPSVSLNSGGREPHALFWGDDSWKKTAPFRSYFSSNFKEFQAAFTAKCNNSFWFWMGIFVNRR